MIMKYYSGNYFVADIAMAIAIGFIFTVLAFFASGFPGNSSWRKIFSISGYAYLFIAFAGFFNIYFHELVYSGHNLAPWTIEQVGLRNEIPVTWVTPDLGTLKIFIPLITLFGAISSFIMLTKLAKKYAVPVFARRFHQGILFVTSVLFLAIL